MNLARADLDDANDRRPVRRPPNVRDEAAVRREREILDAVRRAGVEHAHLAVVDDRATQSSWRWFANATTSLVGEQTRSVTRPMSPLVTSRGSLGASARPQRDLLVTVDVGDEHEVLAVVEPLRQARARAVCRRRDGSTAPSKSGIVNCCPREIERELRAVGMRSEMLERLRGVLEASRRLRRRANAFRSRSGAPCRSRRRTARSRRRRSRRCACRRSKESARNIRSRACGAECRFRRARTSRGCRCPRGRPGRRCDRRSTSASTDFRRAAAVARTLPVPARRSKSHRTVPPR